MSKIQRSLAIGFVLALAWTFVPASISPTGGIELDGLCASGDCERKAGAFCVDGGQPIFNYRNVIG